MPAGKKKGWKKLLNPWEWDGQWWLREPKHAKRKYLELKYPQNYCGMSKWDFYERRIKKISPVPKYRNYSTETEEKTLAQLRAKRKTNPNSSEKKVKKRRENCDRRRP